MLRLTCVVLVLAASACTLDFGGDDTGDDCVRANQGNDLRAPLPSLLNPETLECQSFGGGCNPQCGQCPPQGEIIPTWGYCDGACSGLDQYTCRQATECRAVYDYNCYTGDGPCTALQAYSGCYPTDMTGPIEGSCVGLDAQTCSQHDDCVALHTPQCSGDPSACYQQFVECQDEVTCFTPTLCDIAGPSCPPGQTAAIKNGCYTGACILLSNCEPVCDGCG